MSASTDRIERFRQAYHRAVRAADPEPAACAWRLERFERGVKLAGELEVRIGDLEGKQVLEIGTAHGGDTFALCAHGVHCVGTDKFDHDYGRLLQYLPDDGRLRLVRTDAAGRWPFADRSFDVIVCFGVLEIVQDLATFFAELARVLRPYGLAMIDTATALRMVHDDPLYHLPVIGALPIPIRRFIAERIFHRKYRFEISTHTFYTARGLGRFAQRCGCRYEPMKYATSQAMARAARWPMSGLWQGVIRNLAFDFIYVTPPGTPKHAT